MVKFLVFLLFFFWRWRWAGALAWAGTAAFQYETTIRPSLRC